MMLIGLQEWIMKMKVKSNLKKTDEDEEYKDNEEQDEELEEATSIDPGEIDDIIEDEANLNEHQDDGDHQESKENTGIKELSGAEPRVPSESETSEPLDPPENESNTSAVKSGPSNLRKSYRKVNPECQQERPIQ